MKITGIIAEYNPFHNGHLYHLHKARRETGADYLVVVMSGDFTQRGAPALADKFVRTRMALACGAVAQIGDLSFSLIKREFGIKDYGRLFLAHGGVLDRFDSVLFVAPVMEIIFSLLP